MYLCKADSTVYFLNQNGVDKWVNPLDIGNERELYPLDFIPNSLSIVPLYKTDFLSWGDEKFYYADNRGGIHIYLSIRKKGGSY